MEPEQAKGIIAHFTSHLDRIRRSLTYSQVHQSTSPSIPTVSSPTKHRPIPAEVDPLGEPNPVPRPSGGRRLYHEIMFETPYLTSTQVSSHRRAYQLGPQRVPPSQAWPRFALQEDAGTLHPPTLSISMPRSPVICCG